MQTRIIYHKQDQVHRLVDVATGEVLGTWPRSDKRAAEWAQIEREAPALAELARALADKHPTLEIRAIHAVQLLVEGHVRRNGTPGAFDVRGQTHPDQTYQVHTWDGPPRCDCPDWKGGAAGKPRLAPTVGSGPKCKHVLAVLLALKSETSPVTHTGEVRTAPSQETHSQARQPDCTTSGPARQHLSGAARDVGDERADQVDHDCHQLPNSADLHRQRQLWAAALDAARRGKRLVFETRATYRVAV